MPLPRRLPPLLLCLVLLLAVYAWQVEPRLLVVRRVAVPDATMASAWPGLTIVHLSDPHINGMGSFERRLLERIRGLKPDLILMSGDYQQWSSDPGPAQDFLAQLAAPLGVYGVLGDADLGGGQEGCRYCHPPGNYRERLHRPRLLQNERSTVTWQGKSLTLAGIDPNEAGKAWFAALCPTLSGQATPTLILSHLGAPWRQLPPDAHVLWLAGDTHGGQIRLPTWLCRLLPYKPDPEHMGGLTTNGQGGWLLVNRGLGMTRWLPFRLGVPPEIDVITFIHP